MKRIALVCLCLALSSAALAQQTCPEPTAQDKKASQIPLCFIAIQIAHALNAYNTNATSKSLPPLSRAVFDFKTTTSTTVGGSVNFFIFKFGASHEKDTTNEVSFNYMVPSQPFSHKTKPKLADFTETLLKTIEAAAEQVQQTPKAAGLPFENLTVTLAYGITWDINGGAASPVSLVTVGATADRKSGDVQTITLTFGK